MKKAKKFKKTSNKVNSKNDECVSILERIYKASEAGEYQIILDDISINAKRYLTYQGFTVGGNYIDGVSKHIVSW